MAPSRKTLVAALIGLAAAGVSLASLAYGLHIFAEMQGQAEAELSARRTVMLAESRIEEVLQALDELLQAGAVSCDPQPLDRMRRTAFITPAIKEIAVVAPDGETLCTGDGLPPGRRVPVSSQAISPADDAWLDVVGIGEPAQRMVSIRRQVPGSGGLAALIPPELLMPPVSAQGGLRSGYALLAARDGTAIGETGAKPEGAAARAGVFSNAFEAPRYGLRVSVSLSWQTVAAGHSDWRLPGLAGGLLAAAAIGAFAWHLPRRRRDDPMTQMRQALAAGQFVPYYQPIVNIATGRLVGAEVLARWRKDDGSVVGPGVFIPAAESSGFIMDLTRALMEMASREIGPALERRPDFKVGFNLAARHFADEKILAELPMIFGERRIRLSQLVLEVTEREPIANLAIARKVIAALQAIGVRVAIDDVGTGHNGLSYMLKLGVDIIKVDKMFIDALGEGTHSKAIVETLIDLARNMRMDIVAEGAENFEQVTTLRDRGLLAAQGYVFAPPLPGGSFLTLLDATEELAGGLSGEGAVSAPPQSRAAA